jgi:hypothetical protein
MGYQLGGVRSDGVADMESRDAMAWWTAGWCVGVMSTQARCRKLLTAGSTLRTAVSIARPEGALEDLCAALRGQSWLGYVGENEIAEGEYCSLLLGTVVGRGNL